MRIGELARLAGTSTRALRHYEERGLLAARRLANGYRDYSAADLRAVEEIRARVADGFALAETRPFVECLRAGEGTSDACVDSIEGYRRRIAQVDAEIARLLHSRERLAAQLDTACRGARGQGDVPPALPGCVLFPAAPGT
ncbi:MerR family transcriptional regulator [Parafrankia sp. FMc2]|uniref:MerR family transcriptional regulator n=1 Tax=Parafrankia sp. FMc2 TaxID=3233196 RepID=UPI0034D65E6B